MILGLEINNFQSHLHSNITFVPTLNIITGGTDSGKSTILRALKWVTSGKPTGFAFLSHNANRHGGFVSVDVEFNDCKISRYKSKSRNEWNVNGLKLSATGKNVPDEAQELMNWSDINYCSQFEPYFLLSETNGQIAKRMNSIVGLDIVDDAISKVGKDIRKTNSDIRFIDEEIEELEEELKEYSFVEKAIKDEKKIKEVEKETIQLSKNVKYLSAIEFNQEYNFQPMIDIIDKMNSINDSIKYLSSCSFKTVSFDTVKAMQRVKELECRQAVVNDVKADLNTLKDAFLTLDKSVTIPPIDNLENASKNIKEIEEIVKHISLLSANICNISYAEKEIEEQEELLKNQIGDCCPLCGK